MAGTVYVDNILTDTGTTVNVSNVHFTTSGNVGIGTATPALPIDVISNTGSLALSIRGRASDNIGTLMFYTNDGVTNTGQLQSRSDELRMLASGARSCTFYTNGSERGRFNTTGAFVFAGGTTTADGIGITFPATQSASTNANTLDDYEEGTWTPAVRGSGTAGTYQQSGATAGTYTKVGNLVTIICNIQLTTITGGGTGYLQITGIPFSNSETAQGAVQMQGLDMTTNYTWLTAMPITTGTTTWYLSESGDNQAGNDFPISGVSSNDVIRFTATYRAS